MKCRKCSVDFVWDHENPPGYACPSCGNTMSACAVCEEPHSGLNEFCSTLCEGQFYQDLEVELEKTEKELGLEKKINRLGDELKTWLKDRKTS